jgi:uncharacterized protein with FMN-binding domain
MIPRRAVTAIVTTALGLVLLFSFRTPSDSAVAGAAAATSRPGVTSATGGQPTQTPAPTVPAAPSATSAPTPVPTTAPTAAPSQPGGMRDGQYAGAVVNIRWGAVQVEVTIAGGRITDVTPIQLPSSDPRTAQISEYAEPLLRSAVVEAQTAEVDLVSGATYTSDAYLRSLQSALDQAGG